MENLFNLMNSVHIGFRSAELSKSFVIFLMFSVIGWICEVIYVGLFFERKFVNRGFLHGPLCPIYGVGGLLILLLPEKLQNPVWVLFLSGTFFCTIVEYLGSWILEKLFHTTWWDYSAQKISLGGKTIPLNLHGRVCLKNSLLFGLMSVSVIKFVQPLMEKLLSSVPELAIQIVANVLAVIFAADLFFTVRKLVDFSLYMSRLKELGESLKDRYQSEVWFRSGSLREMIESVKERSVLEKEKFSSALLEKIESAGLRHKISERFIKKFPHMKSDAYNAPVLMLKEKLKKINEKNKKR